MGCFGGRGYGLLVFGWRCRCGCRFACRGDGEYRRGRLGGCKHGSALVDRLGDGLGKVGRCGRCLRFRGLLGSVRAIGHGKAAMTLMATAVTDVSGFAVPLELYARWVSENPERERAMLLNCIAKSECQVAGVLVNDLCSVDDRVEIAVAVLFRAAGITEAQLPAALLWDTPVSDIASLVHAERAMTSRAVGRMVSSGLLERSGRTFVLKAVPPAARLWWDA